MPTGRTSVLPLLPLKPLPANPTVSVLITSYNYGRFLGQAIESALGQSYRPMEVIVSDDGSEDNSCEVVQGYIDRGEPVKLLRGEHRGMAGSLNAAFEASSGDIICLLDADDYFLPGKIEAVVYGLRSEPSAGFAIHRAQMVDQHDRQRGIYPLLRSLPQGDCLETTLHNAGVLMGLPPTSNLSLRRETALSIFPIPERFRGYAEQVIHRIAPLVTSICAIDQPLSVWRLHGRNDGNSARVAAERLERELSYMRDLWFEQSNHLIRRNPEVAKRMPALESNPLYMRMRYMQLRLLGDPAARECHSALCALSEPNRSPVDFFWRHSLYLPRPLFQKCVDLLLTQNVWKEWLSRAVRRRHAR
ncbi:MAG TPA: glycosyltransferase family A protein [Acidobacteriaceae bacterium]|nr:glycosyltransferase family A protein [Acidobacteriaceae bacterium]